MKRLLDCDSPVEEAELAAKVADEDPEFTDFLNFFELVAYLTAIRTLSRGDAEALLGYYFELLQQKPLVSAYIEMKAKSFENLRTYLKARKSKL